MYQDRDIKSAPLDAMVSFSVMLADGHLASVYILCRALSCAARRVIAARSLRS
jgi:hypothetical protein